MTKIDVSQISGQSLRVFLTVFEQTSVSQAALTLGVSQSSVSHTLERLRGVLGVELFQKSGRGISPTLAALRLAPQVREILTAIEALGEGDDYDPVQDMRPCVIAMNGGAMAVAARRIQSVLWEQVPQRQIQFRELGSRGNLADVMQGLDVDLAIVPRLNAYAQSLRTVPLYLDKSAVFYDSNVRGAVQTVAEYGRARHVVLDFGGVTKSAVEQRLEEYSISREVCMGVPNVWMLAEAIRGTDMIATLPSMLSHGVMSDLAQCKLPFPMPDICFDLVWHMRQQHSARNSWMRQLIIDAFATRSLDGETTINSSLGALKEEA
ncbi:LysR family transcriptional regulator [Tritonibacter aquimaris]|nr:LysR family transcriptional regulator [Tritonibacter aquimaris]